MRQELDKLRDLGSAAELEAVAARMHTRMPAPGVNAHVHLPPNFSAFESVRQAVELASAQRVRVLGASNYYDFSVYAELAREAGNRGILPLFGIEIIVLLEDLAAAGILINDPGNPGKMYICGKGIMRFDPMTPAARHTMARIRQSDEARMRTMVERMGEIFSRAGVATGLTADRITDRIVRRHGVDRSTVCLQERHIAEAFQAALFELSPPEERTQLLSSIFGARSKAPPDERVKVQNEIRTHLMKKGKPAFVAESFISFAEAYDLILELGGIPSYPTLADGTLPICTYEDPPDKLISVLLANGVHCAEFIPVRNRPDVLERYVVAMREAGLVITGGTEHNAPDLIPMEPACLDGAPVPGRIKEIFWEGACVVAAHQFLRLHGRRGYVDDRGRLNPSFSDGEGRIDHFRRLGEAVIARYDENAAQS